jgi:SEC-C motif
MSPELRELIDTTRWHQGAVRAAAALLPADDAELDRWIEQSVAANDEAAFIHIVAGAVSIERKIDARHLAHGTALVPNHILLGAIAWRMEGDVASHLLTAVRETILYPELHAMALLVAAAWWREHRDGAPPAELIAEARVFARREQMRIEPLLILLAMASIVSDAGLTEVLREREPERAGPEAEEKRRAVAEATIALWRLPILDLVNERPPDHLGAGGVVRRAGPRIGRNEWCPCGSGRKYKRCCADKDQERLRLSSDVAGKTLAEVRAEPEPHLTLARLQKARPHEVARYDPAKVPLELRGEYLMRLGVYGHFERAVEAFEKLGWTAELHEAWDFVVFSATRARRKDTVERLVQWRTAGGETLEGLVEPATRLLLVRDDPAATLELLEAIASAALETSDSAELTRVAFSLLHSPSRALGILIARSTIPLLEKKDAGAVLREILQTRDRLSLSPDEPYADLLDKRYADEMTDHDRDAEKLHAALDRLEQKSAEVRRLNESLAQAHRDLERRENAPAPAPASAAPSTPVDEEALRELRGRVAALKSDLKQRHSERSELRRELEKAHADLETLRASRPAPATSTAESAAAEDALLAPAEIDGHQPLRVIEFPRKFSETLAEVPRHVARHALALVGRIAGGEPAAFAGVVRLKALPDTLRVRVGIDHRLLFRLLPDRVQVVDLIPRQDLERRIKTLL